jgi:hypothetical protein
MMHWWNGGRGGVCGGTHEAGVLGAPCRRREGEGRGFPGRKSPVGKLCMPGVDPAGASIIAAPVEASTDDVCAEPYGTETPDYQAPGYKEEEPKHAPDEQQEKRPHVVPLSTSRIATMRAARSTPAQPSFCRAVLTAPSLKEVCQLSWLAASSVVERGRVARECGFREPWGGIFLGNPNNGSLPGGDHALSA